METENSMKAILFGYSLFGIIIFILTLWVVKLRKRLEDILIEHNIKEGALEKIMNMTFNAVVIIEKSGIIKYVNQATEKVLGSNKTAGRDIFRFETLKKTKLEQAIRMGFKGFSQELRAYRHISATTGEEKYINLAIAPYAVNKEGVVEEILMIVNDVSLENELANRLQQNFLTTFQSLASIIDARDSYTGKHSENVSHYAELLLEEMNISEDLKKNILIAAKLHDIGKVGIPDCILNKIGQLDSLEYDVMKKHPVIGANLLADIEQFKDSSHFIRHHHERWDGSGYPDGIEGEDIPLGAQVISIADAFDAMRSERIYRKSISYIESLEELKRNKWKQFNGDLVDLFIKALDSQKN